MSITVYKKYVVYELQNLLETKSLTLRKIDFKNGVSNSFQTEEQAVEALIKDNKTFENYIISIVVYLTDY